MKALVNMDTHSLPAHSRWMYLAFPATVMSLGWAFRGFIGGGPLGAMIPGALVALALLWLLERHDAGCGMVAAFGAVGIGFGGQMTYGQTVGLASDFSTMAWGLLGLTVKGAVWGLLGGAVLGLALTLSRARPSHMLSGFTAMVLATWAGWATVNAPRRIYFSNPLDRPREEVWAGLLCGALALLLCFAIRPGNRAVWRFALYACVGGGLGFGLGGVLLAWGRNSALDPQLWPWWKGMEYSFGLLFGLALGLAAWRERPALLLHSASHLSERAYQQAFRGRWLLGWVLLLSAGAIAFEYFVSFRFNYTVLGVMLLFVALYVHALAWHIAITLTSFAFLLDLAEGVGEDWKLAPLWLAVLGAALVAALLWRQLESVRAQLATAPQRAFHLLLWASFAVTSVKTMLQVWVRPHVPTEYAMFVVAMAVVLWLARRMESSRLTQADQAGYTG